jgi:ubiquinone/menaquinone biosynthesis C-methylase UbiE
MSRAVPQSDPTGLHEWHSDSYVEEWIGNWSDPERVKSLRRIAHHIPHDPDRAIRVLDMCGGWGPVTSVVLEAFPKAQVTLHDFSEPMLNQARERLAKHGSAMSFHRGDLMTPAWKDGLTGQFDAVVSSLGIHNVRFPDRIHAIYQEIFPLVAPGGCFINLDQAPAGEIARSAARHAQLMAQRHRIYEETGQWKSLSEIAPSESGGQLRGHDRATEEDRKRIASHEPNTLGNQLRWLLDAGFDDVDCFARERNGALIGAFRAK